MRHNKVQAEKQLPHCSETTLLLNAPLGLFNSGHIQFISYSFSSALTLEVEVKMRFELEVEDGKALSNLVAKEGVSSDLTGLNTHRTLRGFNAITDDDEEEEEDDDAALFFSSFPVPSAKAMTWQPSKLKNSNLHGKIKVKSSIN